MSSTRRRTQSGGKAERPCRIVRVTVTKHHLAVFDQLEDCLRDPVVMSRRGFETGGPLGYRIFDDELLQHGLDHRGRLVIPAGLLPRCLDVLKDHGFRVAVADLREFGPRLTPNHSVVTTATGDDRWVLERLAAGPLAQLQSSSVADGVRLIRLVASLFTKARVFVALPTLDDAEPYHRSLDLLSRSEVGRHFGQRWVTDCGVTVCTPETLTHSSVQPKESVLVLPEADKTAGDVAVSVIGCTPFGRRYAFTRPGTRRDRLVADRVEAIAGPLLSRPASGRPGVRVVGCTAPSVRVAAAYPGLAWKREAVWQNKGSQRSRRRRRHVPGTRNFFGGPLRGG